MAYTALDVKALRDKTGLGMMDCKKALEENGGNMDQAIDYLRKKGLAASANKAARIASEGIVESYIHPGGRVGVLIELNCETDFVARTDEFQRLVRDLAIQVAGLRPIWTSIESIPAAELEVKRTELMAGDMVQGKPEAVRAQIVDGQLKKWFGEVVLLEQPFRDQDRTVGQLVVEAIAKTGENIKVRRFVRFELGE